MGEEVFKFPGGGLEYGEGLIEGLNREFEEEMGVTVPRKDVIAELTERYIPPSQFAVKPFVAAMNRMPTWNIDTNEVAQVIVIPVVSLLPDNALRSTLIKMVVGQEVSLPAFHFNEHVIWGATAIMLAEFVAAWKGTFANPEDSTLLIR